MLKPGTYRLEYDVKNPKPDRRQKHDWRAWPKWAVGDEFLVRAHDRSTNVLAALDEVGVELTPEKRAKLIEDNFYSTILLVGSRWSHQEIGPGDRERYAALEEALRPIEETIEAMFTRLGVRDYFGRWLVESKRLTPQLFEALWSAYQQDEETPAYGPALFEASPENAQQAALLAALRLDNERLRAVLDACPFGVKEGTEELQLMTPRSMPEAQICEWVQRVYEARKPSNKVALATVAASGGIDAPWPLTDEPDDDPYEGSWREAADNEGARIAAESCEEGEE